MDYDRLRLQEMVAISELLHQLDDGQWDAPSLCEGWRVRDVVSHMCLGYTTPMPSMVGKLGRYGFNIPKASLKESISHADRRTPAEILEVFDGIHTNDVRKGIARVIKPSEGLVDHLIHHQDIRRPLGLEREMPEERLVAALGIVPGLAGFVGAKKRVAGLRLVASDVGWSNGDGPEVTGRGEAILLTASGRPVALDELEGEGVGTLTARIAA
jgi:uncharacterized protein (TIGR03083 family)